MAALAPHRSLTQTEQRPKYGKTRGSTCRRFEVRVGVQQAGVASARCTVHIIDDVGFNAPCIHLSIPRNNVACGVQEPNTLFFAWHYLTAVCRDLSKAIYTLFPTYAVDAVFGIGQHCCDPAQSVDSPANLADR
ncbi:unnamed protein product [Ectocarpus sp. 12 AP-2014]